MKKAVAPARIVAVPRSAERPRFEHLDEPHLEPDVNPLPVCIDEFLVAR